MATNRTIELARHYLAIVDSGDESLQGEPRTNAHEALMDAMTDEGIAFANRVEARELARRLLETPATFEPRSTVMWSVHFLNASPIRYSRGLFFDYDSAQDFVQKRKVIVPIAISMVQVNVCPAAP